MPRYTDEATTQSITPYQEVQRQLWPAVRASELAANAAAAELEAGIIDDLDAEETHPDTDEDSTLSHLCLVLAEAAAERAEQAASAYERAMAAETRNLSTARRAAVAGWGLAGVLTLGAGAAAPWIGNELGHAKEVAGNLQVRNENIQTLRAERDELREQLHAVRLIEAHARVEASQAREALAVARSEAIARRLDQALLASQRISAVPAAALPLSDAGHLMSDFDEILPMEQWSLRIDGH